MVKNKTQNRTQTFIIVNFLDLDTSKITLNKLKPNKYGGGYAALRYDDKLLYVRYDGRISPFGLSTNKDTNGNVTGYCTSINLKKNDPYLEKACELDEFFINQCIENSLVWGLGGSKTKKINRSSIAGYDEKGDKGKWKRILKHSYKIDKNTKERIYLDYPPRMEFNVPESVCKFFDKDGKPCCASQLTNFTKISVLAMWGSVALGTWGASIKPKAQQIKVFNNENLVNDECLLEEEAGDLGDFEELEDFEIQQVL